VDLIHPTDESHVVEAMRAATTNGTRVSVVGGRRHHDAGDRGEVDAELWTTALDRVVAYDPAEMLCVVESGMRLGELRRLLADGGQEWPVDELDDATVGGVIAADVPLPRQLRVGCLRDTVVEMVFVTGDGRRIRSGARTVKNVTGYDLHRLLTGSHGTLGVITQVALKVRPLPKAAKTLVTREGGIELAARLLEAVPLPAAVIAEHDRVLVRLEGWPEEVAEQARTANAIAVLADADPATWLEPAFPDARIVAQAAIVPSRLAAAVADGPRYRALLGVGYAWIPCDDEAALARVRERIASLGGIAPLVGGAGGLGTPDAVSAALGARLKAAFDPANILAPGLS
jgi:glycolate dehydrogenase FAD-binding subunit